MDSELDHYKEEGDFNYTESQTFSQDASVIQLRLSTEELVHELIVGLTGEVTEQYVDTETQQIRTETRHVGERLCNNRGVRAFVSYFRMIVNAQTLQSNIKDSRYDSIISDCRLDINDFIFENRKEWDISLKHYDLIINTMMRCISMIYTHPVNAGTLRSLTQSSRIHETTRPSFQGTEGFMQRMGLKR